MCALVVIVTREEGEEMDWRVRVRVHGCRRWPDFRFRGAGVSPSTRLRVRGARGPEGLGGRAGSLEVEEMRRRWLGGGGTPAGLLQRGSEVFAGLFGPGRAGLTSLPCPVGYREGGGGSSLPLG
jgi:hypothetical protein